MIYFGNQTLKETKLSTCECPNKLLIRSKKVISSNFYRYCIHLMLTFYACFSFIKF